MDIKIIMVHDFLRFHGNYEIKPFNLDSRYVLCSIGMIRNSYSYPLLNCISSLIKMYEQNRFVEGQTRISQPYTLEDGSRVHLYCEKKFIKGQYPGMLLGVEDDEIDCNAVLSQPKVFELQDALNKAKNWIAPEARVLELKNA